MRKHHSLSSFLLAVPLGFAIFSLSASTQTTTSNEWTWMGGSNTVSCTTIQGVTICGGRAGVYGTLGTSAAGNMPGSRVDASSWTDSNGNFWLFGGNAFDVNGQQGFLNDLWEYKLSTGLWAWMGGSSALTCSVTNGDTICNGPAGVYGTLELPAVGNSPGGRESATTWTDSSGNLWLFGGDGYDASGIEGYLNDLWEFIPSTNEWDWMGGSSIISSVTGGQPGVYGTLGTPSAGNIPGSREAASSWIDLNGNFWLFGGNGFDSQSHLGSLNDLWEFNPSTDEWTWRSGNSTVSNPASCPICGWPGVYGTLESPAAGNIPGSRSSSATWIDSGGNLWLFGGAGFDANGNGTLLNDLWEFNPSTNEWAWMSGGTMSTGCTTYNLGVVICAGQPGVYGTLATPAAENTPGGRNITVSWSDENGNFWLFGGQGYDAADKDGILNDLWEFNPSTNEWAWIGGDSTMPDCLITPWGSTFCKGQPAVYGTLGMPAPANTPGGREEVSSWTDKKGNFWLFGGDSPSGYILNDLWEYFPYPTDGDKPDFSVADSSPSVIVTAGQSGTDTVTVTPLNGFNSSVSFNCSSGMPSGATCSFSPATVTPSGAQASTTLTVTTLTTTAAFRRKGRPMLPVSALAVELCFFGLRKLRRLRILLLLVVSVIGLTLITGCGTTVSIPITSVVTVTATSGSLQHTTSFSLTVF